ncbi:MAG: hypothetical protein BAA04_09415 [Firmicutes bacterium ZCTH02-B6]|nr:MAG: hypothetical protein BAA04_09415 [Firmicutes bacterium ZCTH02-B6]
MTEAAGQIDPIWQPLAAVAGPDHVRPANPARDAVDGVVPRAVVAPPDEETLACVLAYCHNHRLAVAPRGGGTQMRLGNVPERLDVVLDLGRLSGIVHYEPADLTVTVQAGMRLDDLQAELARHGQFLPIDPPGGGRATIGGLLATGTSGPLRAGFGHLRDRLLGMRVVRADGTVVRSGGRVVKNVAGYDMGRLHTGALGTLGVIVEATFKVQPLPAAWGAVAIAPGGGAGPRAGDATALLALEEVVAALLDAPAQPVLAEIIGPPARLVVGFAGTKNEVDYAVQQACRIADKSAGTGRLAATPLPWAETHAQVLSVHREGAGPVKGRGALVCRLHVPSDRAAALIAEAAAEAAAAGVDLAYAAHAAAGIIRLHLGAEAPGREAPGRAARAAAQPDAAAAVYRSLILSWLARCRDLGGNLVVERAPAALKRELPVWGDPPASLFLMRALKEKFDPHRILNPGRYVGGI